jgi:pyruvate kinase
MVRTKIVATIGPASRSPEVLAKMIEAGLDVARINFSYGNHALYAETIERIRAASVKVGVPVAILGDLQGPRLRVGQMAGEGVTLILGQRVTLTTDESVIGQGDLIPVQYKALPQALEAGDRILLDDGLLEMVVQETTETTVTAEMVIGGLLKSNKGFNLPCASLAISAITKKDRKDLIFALQHQVDWIALSFVREAAEVLELKTLIRQATAAKRVVPVISKISKPEGVKKIDEIIEVSEGIIISRGHLAIETSSQEVPMSQKMIIRKSNAAGIPVITATEMLDSMIWNPRPTRAEASDVANAILDGTDAIMLSGETAVGAYPLRTIQMIRKIAEKAEAVMLADGQRQYADVKGVAAAVAQATVKIALGINAAAIITPTASGATARLMSKYRPAMPIVATTPSPFVQRQLCLHWGVISLLARRTDNTDEMINASIRATLAHKLVKEGDSVVITAGAAGHVAGSTNLMKVEVIQHIIGKGMGIGNQMVSGRVRILRPPIDPMLEIDADEIIVTERTNRSFVNVTQRAAGLITVQPGLNSDAAILAVELGIPTMVGVSNALRDLRDGQIVTIDTRQGCLYDGRLIQRM